MDDNDKKITEIDKVEMTINKQGDQIWWKGNKLHREDGPAIERANGTKEWCLNNMALTELEIRQLQRNKQFNQSIEEALK